MQGVLSPTTMEALIAGTLTLKPISKSMYLSSISRACDYLQVSSGWEIVRAGPGALQPYLDTISNASTRNGVIVAFTSVWRLDSRLKETHHELFHAWDSRLRQTQQEARARYSSSAPAEGENFVPMPELRRAMRSSSTDIDTRLLLCCHIEAPARCDFGSVRIAATESEAPATGSRYILDTRILTVEDHKTSSVHGSLRYTMSAEFAELLRLSRVSSPRDYLFVGKNGQPMNSRYYSVYVRRRLVKLFGPGVSVNVMRKAYATERAVSTLTNGEQDRVAATMGNSTHTLNRVYDYRGGTAPGPHGS